MIVNPITNVFQETFLDNDFMYFYRQARLAKYKYISTIIIIYQKMINAT